MFKSLYRDPKIVILAILTVFIKLFSLQHDWVERFYTYGIYPIIASIFRMLFGWIPFSIGDLIYLAAALYLIWRIWTFIRTWRKKKERRLLLGLLVISFVRLLLLIYVLFNVFWGLNYDRKGIAPQLDLEVKRYTTEDLKQLATLLQAKLNTCASQTDSVSRQQLDQNRVLFQEGVSAYGQIKDQYPFLQYNYPSIKPSMYSYIGQYFGFTGYYNPFSGEAQLKTTVPVFLKPFIITHEIGHQLGYGKENEANFVGYLACRSCKNVDFRYSVYFEMTLYVLSDLRSKDSMAVKQFRKNWHPRVQNDYRSYVNYLIETRNPIEPIIMRFYDQFLKLNNQPMGKETYNEVVAWLVAYMKKYGEI